MIYLDYSANTPVDPRVLAAYSRAALDFPGNANSRHAAGRAAAAEMRRTISGIAALVDVRPEEIILTSGASESNNLAIKGTARVSRHIGKHMVSTALEHSSVSGTLTALKDRGWEIDLAGIVEDGKIDLEELETLIREDTVLVAVSAVDSELGTVQPVEEIAEILDKYPDCRLHVDATQAIGKLPMEKVRRIIAAADLVSFTPHKFYGLLGSGVLIKKKGVVLEPLIHGGASTTVYRSGTPDTAAAEALEKALSIAAGTEAERFAKVRALNNYLRDQLAEIPSVRINSPADAVPHILNLSVCGVKGDDMQKRLDDAGICVSVKSACSVRGTPSRAVYAVSRDRRRAMESWRISLSHLTTREELDSLVEVVKEAAGRRKS